MPLPRSGRGRGRESAANTPNHRGGGPARAVPATRVRGRQCFANPPNHRRGHLDRAARRFGGRDLISVDCHGQRTPCEEEQHVGSCASAQTPQPDGLQHLDFSNSLPCKEKHVAEPASAQTLHKLDVLSLKDLHYTTAMEGLSTTTPPLISPRNTIEIPPSSRRRCLSSSPIWIRCDCMWGITFYTIKDRRGYFHTFPRVGGSFHSKEEAYKAIDRYLTDHEDLTMFMGLSEVDKLVWFHRYYPDGTKRRLKPGQPIDKMRDMDYQLVQAVVGKYNDHHNLFGDLAYEVKDVIDKPSRWEEEDIRMYIHMNFTAKTKGSNGFDTGSDNLFFAEVTYVRGEDTLVVNCCCMVKQFDNGPCLGCGTTMKHPNDGNAYNGGHMNATYSLPYGSFPIKATWIKEEDSDEEVERLRIIYGGAPYFPCTA